MQTQLPETLDFVRQVERNRTIEVSIRSLNLRGYVKRLQAMKAR